MKKIIILLTLIIVTFIVILLFILNNKPLKILFFDSGKSDSILITYKDKVILIDTAQENYSNEIINYLNKKNIKTIDYLIITHFDKDHVGGASKIIDNFDIKNIYQSNYIKDSDYYNNYIKSLNNKNIKPKTIENKYEFKVEDLEFTIYGTDKIYEDDSSNNSSLITLLKYKNNSFIFTGDIENDRIRDFINEDINNIDLIKIPHHGKYEKELKNLLNKIKVKYAVITTSNEEKEENKLIELLDKNKIKYYSTRKGSVLVLSNGSNITIKYDD